MIQFCSDMGYDFVFIFHTLIIFILYYMHYKYITLYSLFTITRAQRTAGTGVRSLSPLHPPSLSLPPSFSISVSLSPLHPRSLSLSRIVLPSSLFSHHLCLSPASAPVYLPLSPLRIISTSNISLLSGHCSSLEQYRPCTAIRSKSNKYK